MKKIKFLSLCVVMLAVIFSIVSVVEARIPGSDPTAYTVNVGSFAINTADSAQFITTISSDQAKLYITDIVITNSDPEVPQTITIYDNCDSTTTATALFTIVMSSPSATFSKHYDPWKSLVGERGAVIRKSSPDSTVHANLLANTR